MSAFLAICSSDAPARRCAPAAARSSALIFFLAVVTVVPFGVGPDLKLLARIGPAILWIAALLASLLGLDRLFGADREDGIARSLSSSPASRWSLYALGRAAGHWIATGLPIVVAAPILGLLLNLEPLAMARGGADASRRHAGADADRRGRRGADRRPAARRTC